uniref:C-type lectin domain-containing protein n=1 Tax=Salarias fasciatus TaxID=181472 RepID=A0A672G8W2_SALFA
RRRFLILRCREQLVMTVVCLSVTELRCPGNDWYEFGEFCYKPFSERKTWHGARQACRAQGAELVSVLSMAEQNWLESYLDMGEDALRDSVSTSVVFGDMWTGLNDLAFSGLFMWSDEHLTTFTYWAPGEPNNHEGLQDGCVEMSHQVRGSRRPPLSH